MNGDKTEGLNDQSTATCIPLRDTVYKPTIKGNNCHGVCSYLAVNDKHQGLLYANAPINVKPHPQYGLCGALGGDLNLNFAPRGGEFEKALYSNTDPLQ